MPHSTAAERLEALRDAFARLADSAADVRFIAHASPWAVSLQAEPAGPRAVLVVGEQGATVNAYSGADPGGASRLEDRLNVDLARGYLWDDVEFDDADDLAHHLVKHMRRRLRELADVGP